jgi:hypothetical protein
MLPREDFPRNLTFYAIAHPEGGWLTVNGCELAHLTLCKAEAVELAEGCHGRVIEYTYRHSNHKTVWPGPEIAEPVSAKERDYALIDRLLRR